MLFIVSSKYFIVDSILAAIVREFYLIEIFDFSFWKIGNLDFYLNKIL